jgi:N utilization substance protein B
VSLLYEANMKGAQCSDVLAALPVPPDPYAAALCEGVDRERERLDAEIAPRARGWRLERMPVLDLAILRLAAYELLDCPDVPVAVVLDEAVRLAKQYSTEESGRFVNGVLAAIARAARPQEVDDPPDAGRSEP